MFGAARVFGVSQHAAQLFADFDGFIERPSAVGVEGDAGFGEAFGQRGHGFGFFKTVQHAAFEFEIVEAVFFISSFSQTHNRFRRQGFFMTHAIPVASVVFLILVRQVGFFAVADKEEIAQHFHGIALLTVAQKRGNGDV